MQRKQWTVAVVGAAILAALVTWKLRGGRDTERAPSSPSATSEPGKGGSAADAKSAQPDHEHGGGVRETPVDEPELRSGPPAALADDEPRGEGRFGLKVVDAKGAPVANAEVQVASRPPRLIKTDERGEALVEGLLVERYLVTARAPAGVAGPVEVEAISRNTPAGITQTVLQLGAAGRVEIAIVDERQQPISGAKVELRGVVEVREASAAQGRAELAQVVPGSYQAAIWADGYVRAFRSLEVSARPTALSVELVRGPKVRGLLMDEQGKPVAGALVRYEIVGGPVPGSELMRDSVKSDASGIFELAALPPVGLFIVVATHAAHGTAVLELLDPGLDPSLDPGKEPKREVKLVMPAGAKVRGKVVEAGGAPVAFARVRVGLTTPGARLLVPPREVFSDAKGEFVADALTRRQLSAVASDGRGSSVARAVDTRGGDVEGVILVLEAVGVMGGVVVDEQGRPVAGAQVTAFPAALDRSQDEEAKRKAASGGSASAEAGHGHGDHGHGAIDPARALELERWQLRGFPRALTDSSGAFRLTALPSGSYRVRAIRGAASYGGRGAGEEVLAKVGDKVGDNEVRLVVGSGGAVKGKVTFADGSAPEELVAAIGFAQHEVAKGELMIEGLAPQTYQLVLRGPTVVPLVVEAKVEAGKTVELGTVVVERRDAAAKPR